MKVYALNASPRKGWNSDEMLDAFIKGVTETNPDIEVEKVNISNWFEEIYFKEEQRNRTIADAHLELKEAFHCCCLNVRNAAA